MRWHRVAIAEGGTGMKGQMAFIAIRSQKSRVGEADSGDRMRFSPPHFRRPSRVCGKGRSLRDSLLETNGVVALSNGITLICRPLHNRGTGRRIRPASDSIREVVPGVCHSKAVAVIGRAPAKLNRPRWVIRDAISTLVPRSEFALSRRVASAVEHRRNSSPALTKVLPGLNLRV
jgi:hypothetical protein